MVPSPRQPSGRDSNRANRISKLKALTSTDEPKKLGKRFIKTLKRRPGSSDGSKNVEDSESTRQLSPIAHQVLKVSGLRESQKETRNGDLIHVPSETQHMHSDYKRAILLQTSEGVSHNRQNRLVPLSSKINSFISKTSGSFFNEPIEANSPKELRVKDKMPETIRGP